MTDIELILTMLGKVTTAKLHRDRDTKGFEPLKKDAKEWWGSGWENAKDIEKQAGKPVVSSENSKALAGGKKKL